MTQRRLKGGEQRTEADVVLDQSGRGDQQRIVPVQPAQRSKRGQQFQLIQPLGPLGLAAGGLAASQLCSSSSLRRLLQSLPHPGQHQAPHQLGVLGGELCRRQQGGRHGWLRGRSSKWKLTIRPRLRTHPGF